MALSTSKLLFHWDENQTFLADEQAQRRLLKLWTLTAKGFGINHLLVIGEAPINGDSEMTIECFKDEQEVRAKYTDEQYLVVVEGGKDIKKFKTPKKNLIITLGSNYADPVVNSGDLTIGIEADIPLWDIVAAGIVLHKVTKWH